MKWLCDDCKRHSSNVQCVTSLVDAVSIPPKERGWPQDKTVTDLVYPSCSTCQVLRDKGHASIDINRCHDIGHVSLDHHPKAGCSIHFLSRMDKVQIQAKF
jgi:hypothetical protein